MSDVNWQAEIRQSVERMVREKKQKLFGRSKRAMEGPDSQQSGGSREDKGGSGCQMRWSLIRV